MNHDDVIAKVIADVADVLDCAESSLSAHSGLGSCPEWDSLAQLRIMLALEEKYQLSLEEFKPEDLFSIEGIVKALTR